MKKTYTLLGLVVMLAFCSVLKAQDYSGVINSHLEANKSKFEVTSQDIANLKVYNQVYSRHNKVTHVYAVQQHNGVEVYNAIANVAIKNNAVVYVGNNMQKDIKSRANGSAAALNPMQAAAKAANALGLGAANFSVESVISSQEFLLSDGGVSLERVPVKLVYQPLENEIRLAWDLSIHTLDAKHWYSVRIDATTGELLDQIDWVTSCSFESHNHVALEGQNNTTTRENTIAFGTKTKANESVVFADEQYNVYAVPLESPAHGDRTIVTEPQDLVASPFGWHDLDGVEGAEMTITRGNNVWAQEDQNANNGQGASPDGTDDLIFDFEIDLTLEPVEYIDASTTNLFYWNNIMHDVFFQYGFDEESGNFQQVNYSSTGLGNDYVQADSQDGSGTNNATFGTPPDGSRPRMSMFLWNASSVPNFVANSPATVAGDYGFSSAGFGDAFPVDGLTGDIALVEDIDTTGDVNDACDPIDNAGDLDGKIAVLRRGECTFVIKVKAAQDAGAIAVIVINNVPGPIINLGGTDGTITIPSGMISMTDGEALLAALASEDVNVTISAPAPTGKDGSLDNGIIAHESGHGISNRLTGGAGNSGCLGNSEQMGEGWSDWFGLMLTIEPGDTAQDVRGIGTYATGAPITSQGIRPAAYSTDTAINALTYDSTNDPSISQPHGIGTVWSTILWDMNWALIDEFGYDADLYNGTGGNNMALQLVVDGLKLQPCGVGFVTGRDAIIAAVDLNDEIIDKTAVKCLLWEIFADRGVGFSASQGSSGSRTDQVAAFDTPPSDVLDCALSVGDEIEVSPFKVYPNPSNGEININVAGVQGEGNVSIFDINGRRVFTQNVSLEGTVQIQAQNLSAGVYIMQVRGVNASQTTKLIIQ
jgi:extracellular elastinolytic metalloproteinase